MIENDYIIETNRNLKPLIITFGGIAGGIYQPIFEFKTFLQSKIDCHFIFFKDSHHMWYHKGIYV